VTWNNGNPFYWGEDCEKEDSQCSITAGKVHHDLRKNFIPCPDEELCYIHSGVHYRQPRFCGYIDNIKVPKGY
jgi:hypothetical protein